MSNNIPFSPLTQQNILNLLNEPSPEIPSSIFNNAMTNPSSIFNNVMMTNPLFNPNNNFSFTPLLSRRRRKTKNQSHLYIKIKFDNKGYQKRNIFI